MFGLGDLGSMGAVARIGAPGIPFAVPAYVALADGVPADVYMDFINNKYYGAVPGGLRFLRNSPAWGDNQAGIWTQFAANQMVLTDKGLIINPQVTNSALQCRDLTQAPWVATGLTPTKIATGIDGTFNSATRLTANGTGTVNATMLQSITQASASTIVSFFLRRVNGAGPINITADGGTTWTAVTLTSTFQRFSILQTLANPSIGIQIVTGNDIVAVDFAQCELAGPSNNAPTSPILTTTAAAMRNTDLVTLPATIGSAITILAIATPVGGPIGSPIVFAIGDGVAPGNQNRLWVGRNTTNARASINIGGTASNMVIATAWVDGTSGKIAATAAANAGAACFNAGTVAPATPTGFPANLIELDFGIYAGANSPWYIATIAAWFNHKSSNAALQAMTAASGLNDGFANAPAGAAQYPTLLNGYTVRPPWKVAGVDYRVGFPTGQTFTNIRTSQPANTSLAGNTLSVNADNVTINGYDFTTGGGVQISCAGHNNLTITNCNLGGTNYLALSTSPIDFRGNNLTVTYNVIDGGATTAGATVNETGLFFVFPNNTTACNVIIQYNWLKNSPAQLIEYVSTLNAIIDFRFNFIDNFPIASGAHMNYQQLGNGTTAAVWNFNCTRQLANNGGAEGPQWYPGAGGSMILNNSSISNNVFLAPGTVTVGVGNCMSNIIHGSAGGGVTLAGSLYLAQNNFFDPSGSNFNATNGSGAFYPGTMVGWTGGGNTNMNDGTNIPFP